MKVFEEAAGLHSAICRKTENFKPWLDTNLDIYTNILGTMYNKVSQQAHVLLRRPLGSHGRKILMAWDWDL